MIHQHGFPTAQQWGCYKKHCNSLYRNWNLFLYVALLVFLDDTMTLSVWTIQYGTEYSEESILKRRMESDNGRIRRGVWASTLQII